MRKTLVGTVAGMLTILLLSSPAFANGYAYGYTSGGSWGGGYVQMVIQNMTTPDWASGGHTNNTIWVDTNSGTTYWAEVGYTQGFHSFDVFTYYWARYNPSTGYNDGKLDRIGAVGTTHEFEVQQVFDGEYDMYVDNLMVADDVGGSPWTVLVQTGLEYTSTSSTLSATVNYDWHQVRSTACCSWSLWSSGSSANTANHTYTWTTNWYHATVSN